MKFRWLLSGLLALCVARLWLAQLPSSFWVDEMATAFVVEQGAAHPSLAVAPQVPQSAYYWLPRAADRLFGRSEVAYRVPSILAMGIAMLLVARLAARLIHPAAAWFAAFVCVAQKGINFFAADARPYALGMAVAAAAMWFLVRWLDGARRADALAFLAMGALLWRVHLLYWPFYLVLAGYAAVRLARHRTPLDWRRAGAVFAVLVLALVPVARHSLELNREAAAHVIVPPPTVGVLARYLKWNVVLFCAAGAWLARLVFRWKDRARLPRNSVALALAWGLCPPLCLFVFSRVTGDSVFLPRYLSLALPGVALLATAAAAWFLPAEHWKAAALVLGLGVWLLVGSWSRWWTPHQNSDWRAAAQAINHVELRSPTPVISISPFIESRPPEWRPDYPLPGYLYAHLAVYPIHARTYLLPYAGSPEAERFAAVLAQGDLAQAGRFIVYGSESGLAFWVRWFEAQPELAGWRGRPLGEFGDVGAVMFSRFAPIRELATQCSPFSELPWCSPRFLVGFSWNAATPMC